MWREGGPGSERNTEVIQSEPRGQEKGTECHDREVQRERHPKKQKGIQARKGGKRPRWQRRHRCIGWHAEKQESKDTKMAMKQEKADGEDRGGQTGISKGRSPARTPSGVPLTSPSHFSNGALPSSRCFQSYVLKEPLLFDPYISVSLTDN